MRRPVFIMTVLIIVGIVGVLVLSQLLNRDMLSTDDIAANSTSEVCILLDIQGTPDLKSAMAAENLYQQMPMFKTPVAFVATPDKPLDARCMAADD